MQYVHFPFYLLFFLVNQQECLVLPLCWESTPAVGRRGGRRYLHVGFPLVSPRNPVCRGYGPTCRTRIRLGLLCEGSASQCHHTQGRSD